MNLNCSPEMLTSWFQKIFLINFFKCLWEQITNMCGGANLNPRVIDCKRSSGFT